MMSLQEVIRSIPYRRCMIQMPAAIIFLFFSTGVYAQYQHDWRNHIDQLIRQTDSLAMKSQRTFFQTKYLTNNDPYKESWYYTTRDDKVAVFEIRYMLDSIEYSEVYYIEKNRPVCIELYETVYFSYYEDEIRRGEVLFFVNDLLKQYVSIGVHGRSRSHYLHDPAIASLKKFDDRFTELKRIKQIVELK